MLKTMLHCSIIDLKIYCTRVCNIINISLH